MCCYFWFLSEGPQTVAGVQEASPLGLHFKGIPRSMNAQSTSSYISSGTENRCRSIVTFTREWHIPAPCQSLAPRLQSMSD